MMELEDIKARLWQMLPPKRFSHSLNVMEAAVVLAEKYGEDVDKAALAGLLHDCAKNLKTDAADAICKKYGIETDDILKRQPDLMHGVVGSYLARDLFEVEDRSVLDAIADHTMGRPGMDRLSSIVFIADYIEAGRDYLGVDSIREAAGESLEKAIVAGIDATITHVLRKGCMLHTRTVETRNWALERLETEQGEK